MFACEPTAMKNSGARISRATSSIRPACTEIQMRPSSSRKGLSASAFRSICMPIVAISTYRNTVPILEAPAPSSWRARVRLASTPMVVAITTSQKKRESRL